MGGWVGAGCNGAGAGRRFDQRGGRRRLDRWGSGVRIGFPAFFERRWSQCPAAAAVRPAGVAAAPPVAIKQPLRHRAGAQAAAAGRVLPAPRCGSLRRQLDPAQTTQGVAWAQGQGAGVVVAGFAQGLTGEQPGPQWIGRLALGGAVDEHQQLHGPGQRHIGQPLGLLCPSQVGLLPRLKAHAPAGVQGNVKAGARGTGGVQRTPGLLLPGWGACQR